MAFFAVLKNAIEVLHLYITLSGVILTSSLEPFWHRDWLWKKTFPWTGGGGSFWDNSSTLHLLCTLTSCYCESPRRYWSTAQRLGTHDLKNCHRSVTKSCPTLHNPMNCSTPGSSALHCLPEFAQIHVHGISDAIQLPHLLLPPSPSALSTSQQQASLVGQMVKNLPARWETWVGKIPWRRERQPTPVFLSGEFHGQSLVGYSPWDHEETDNWATFTSPASGSFPVSWLFA